MVIKSLTITEEAYNSLKRLKYGDESFSKVIIRVAKEKKPDVKKYFGILRSSKTTTEEWINRIKKNRNEFDKHFTDRQVRLRRVGG